MQAVAIYYNMKSINKYLDLIFIGTRWNLYPKLSITGENGVILKEGKKFLENTNNIGLRSIIDYNHMNNKVEEGIDQITNFITPAISAVGMVNNGRIILELLITDDRDRAKQIVKYLHNISKQKN